MKNLLKLFRYYLRSEKSKAFVYLFTANFLAAFLSFGSQLFTARWLTPENIGLIRLMQGFIGIGSVIAGFGLNASILKLCSEQRDIGEKKYLLRQSIRYTSFISTAAFFLILIVFCSFYGKRLNSFWQASYFVSIIPLALSGILVSYYQAIKKFKEVAIIQIIVKFFSVIMLVFAVYFWGINGFLCAIVLGVLLSWLVLHFKIDISKIRDVKVSFKEQFDIAKYAVGANGVGQILLYTDIFVINVFVTSKVLIGQYSFATILLIGLNILRDTIQQLVTPYFSEKSSDPFGWNLAYNRYNIVSYLVTLGVATFAYFLVPPIIAFAFSGKYDQAMPFFRILLFAYSARNLYAVSAAAIFSIGRVRYNFYNAVVLLLFNIFVTVFFTARMGIIGAVYAQLIYSIFGYVLVTGTFCFCRRSFLHFANGRMV